MNNVLKKKILLISFLAGLIFMISLPGRASDNQPPTVDTSVVHGDKNNAKDATDVEDDEVSLDDASTSPAVYYPSSEESSSEESSFDE